MWTGILWLRRHRGHQTDESRQGDLTTHRASFVCICGLDRVFWEQTTQNQTNMASESERSPNNGFAHNQFD